MQRGSPHPIIGIVALLLVAASVILSARRSPTSHWPAIAGGALVIGLLLGCVWLAQRFGAGSLGYFGLGTVIGAFSLVVFYFWGFAFVLSFAMDQIDKRVVTHDNNVSVQYVNNSRATVIVHRCKRDCSHLKNHFDLAPGFMNVVEEHEPAWIRIDREDGTILGCIPIHQIPVAFGNVVVHLSPAGPCPRP